MSEAFEEHYQLSKNHFHTDSVHGQSALIEEQRYAGKRVQPHMHTHYTKLYMSLPGFAVRVEKVSNANCCTVPDAVYG